MRTSPVSTDPARRRPRRSRRMLSWLCLAVAGVALPYAVPNWAIDHYPADVGLALGFAPGNARLHGAFFT